MCPYQNDTEILQTRSSSELEIHNKEDTLLVTSPASTPKSKTIKGSKGRGITASCERIPGEDSLERYDQNIKNMYVSEVSKDSSASSSPDSSTKIDQSPTRNYEVDPDLDYIGNSPTSRYVGRVNPLPSVVVHQQEEVASSNPKDIMAHKKIFQGLSLTDEIKNSCNIGFSQSFEIDESDSSDQDSENLNLTRTSSSVSSMSEGSIPSTETIIEKKNRTLTPKIGRKVTTKPFLSHEASHTKDNSSVNNEYNTLGKQEKLGLTPKAQLTLPEIRSTHYLIPTRSEAENSSKVKEVYDKPSKITGLSRMGDSCLQSKTPRFYRSFSDITPPSSSSFYPVSQTNIQEDQKDKSEDNKLLITKSFSVQTSSSPKNRFEELKGKRLRRSYTSLEKEPSKTQNFLLKDYKFPGKNIVKSRSSQILPHNRRKRFSSGSSGSTVQDQTRLELRSFSFESHDSHSSIISNLSLEADVFYPRSMSTIMFGQPMKDSGINYNLQSYPSARRFSSSSASSNSQSKGTDSFLFPPESILNNEKMKDRMMLRSRNKINLCKRLQILAGEVWDEEKTIKGELVPLELRGNKAELKEIKYKLINPFFDDELKSLFLDIDRKQQYWKPHEKWASVGSIVLAGAAAISSFMPLSFVGCIVGGGLSAAANASGVRVSKVQNNFSDLENAKQNLFHLTKAVYLEAAAFLLVVCLNKRLKNEFYRKYPEKRLKDAENKRKKSEQSGRNKKTDDHKLNIEATITENFLEQIKNNLNTVAKAFEYAGIFDEEKVLLILHPIVEVVAFLMDSDLALTYLDLKQSRDYIKTKWRDKSSSAEMERVKNYLNKLGLLATDVTSP
jgi:hypothetical protein